MGLIGKILSFTRGERGTAKRSTIIVDPGSGANKTAEHFTDPSVDAQPTNNDIPVLMPLNGGGRWVVVGYIDPKNEGLTEPGEHRILGRDPGGTIKSSMWLKGDGTILANDIVTIDLLGNIVTTGNVSAANITASAAVMCATIVATGAVSVASLLATGVINAANIIASAAVNAANVIATSDVTGGGVSLKTHTHPVDGNPGNTGAPN